MTGAPSLRWTSPRPDRPSSWPCCATAAPDVVVNCAGVTGGDAVAMAAGNVVAVANLLAALDGTAARSASCTSGRPPSTARSRPAGRCPRRTPPQPVSAYGMSKLAGTELVLAARRQGRAATVLRVFNPIGPGTPESLLPGRLVAALRRSAGTGERARLGRLDGHRDFVDVRDVAAAVRRRGGRRRPLPGVLNVGSGRATALRDLAEAAARRSGAAAAGGRWPDPARSAAVSGSRRTSVPRRLPSAGGRPYSLAASLRDMGLAAVAANGVMIMVARGVARLQPVTVAPRGLAVPAYFHPAVAACGLAGAGRGRAGRSGR